MTRPQLWKGLAAPLAFSVTGTTYGRPAYPRAYEKSIGGRTLPAVKLSSTLARNADAGLLIAKPGRAQRIHAYSAPNDWCGEARCTITPRGDYLLMFTAGTGHYGGKSEKVNGMLAYRSSDAGQTWSGPTVPWRIPYNPHGFVPLQPRGTKRLYAFGTEPLFKHIEDRENAPIGYRWSDDDGHTWSGVTLLRPVNDPEYLGMFVMRMCETDRRTWLLAPHCGMSRNPRHTRMYVLRRANQGRDWTLLPGPRPNGWTEPKYERMEEGRPISLGDGKVLLMTRTAEGHLWQLRSDDDGVTWSNPEPTMLTHPLAPPMVFHLSDRKTLAAFHRNRYTGRESNSPSGADRSELWISLSRDDGKTWAEPRFVLANANQPYGHAASAQSVSHVDAFAFCSVLHIFISHQFRQVVQVQLPEASLAKLPSKRELT